MLINVLDFFNFFPQADPIKPSRVIKEEIIDKSYSWASVDGGYKGRSRFRGVGRIIFSTDDHWYIFSIGLGESTNNYAKLALDKLLLILALSLEILCIHIFGDFKLVFDYMNLGKPPRNIYLLQFFENIIKIGSHFQRIIYLHIFKERNRINSPNLVYFFQLGLWRNGKIFLVFPRLWV